MPDPALFQRTIEHYLAPILPYLQDTQVAEVMVNNHQEVYIEKGGKLHKTEARFKEMCIRDSLRTSHA